jgi:hypothetical protein
MVNFLWEVLIMGDPLQSLAKPASPFLQVQSFYCAALLKGVGAHL